MISYAQNYEDVTLRRAFPDIDTGFYVDVGAYDPVFDSVTKWFSDTGWSGINIEPNPERLRLLEAQRPRDINLGCAIGERAGTMPFYMFNGDGLNTIVPEVMQEVGGDGFLFFNSYFDRRYVMEVCDGLVPELQRRGLTRKAYAHQHLRDNLLEF